MLQPIRRGAIISPYLRALTLLQHLLNSVVGHQPFELRPRRLHYCYCTITAPPSYVQRVTEDPGKGLIYHVLQSPVTGLLSQSVLVTILMLIFCVAPAAAKVYTSFSDGASWSEQSASSDIPTSTTAFSWLRTSPTLQCPSTAHDTSYWACGCLLAQPDNQVRHEHRTNLPHSNRAARSEAR